MNVLFANKVDFEMSLTEILNAQLVTSKYESRFKINLEFLEISLGNMDF